MTKKEIEQKTEEYVIKSICQLCNRCQSYGYKGCETVRKSKQAYIDGYEQGYKQAEKSDIKFCENICHKSDTIKLYKEQEEKIAELEKAITEKNSVIEKMKNDVRNEITRHSNLRENTLSYLLNKWS